MENTDVNSYNIEFDNKENTIIPAPLPVDSCRVEIKYKESEEECVGYV